MKIDGKFFTNKSDTIICHVSPCDIYTPRYVGTALPMTSVFRSRRWLPDDAYAMRDTINTGIIASKEMSLFLLLAISRGITKTGNMLIAVQIYARNTALKSLPSL